MFSVVITLWLLHLMLLILLGTGIVTLAAAVCAMFALFYAACVCMHLVLQVALIKVNKPPVLLGVQSLTVDENLPPGQPAGSVSAFDPDGDQLAFVLAAPSALFTLVRRGGMCYLWALLFFPLWHSRATPAGAASPPLL
jgi:hypothetical protein